jgi:hypothetical protein
MKGDDFLSFVRLHLSALERSPDLEGWFKGRFRHNELEVGTRRLVSAGTRHEVMAGGWKGPLVSFVKDRNIPAASI